MIGQAEVIVGGEIEKSFAADFEARALGGVRAAQFAVQTLFVQRGQTPVQVFVERSHAVNLRFTICDLRVKRLAAASFANRMSKIHFGGIAQRPSIMLLVTLPVCCS